MNIYSKLLLGAAALSFAACSSEEPLGNGEDQPQTTIKPTGDIAYLNVRLQAADNGLGGRADGGYEYGSSTENAVADAYFYFYDENGQFVLESNSWIGGNANSADPTENVEIFGKNTVVLTGLTGKGYPSWVVTMLNIPEGFTPARTLDGMADLYRASYDNGDGKFVMTTSSYFGDDNKNGSSWNYFATKLEPENFLQEAPTKEEVSDATVVNIYVERLAARVGVDVSNISNKRHSQVYTDENGKTYPLYEIDVTVAGEDNPNLGGGSNTAATKVYVAILGWELNSTASSTNYFKNLSGWDNTTDFGRGWAWNNARDHRSFWGKARNYGFTDRNMKVNDFTYADLTQVVETSDPKAPKGTKVYCNETTNTVENILVNNGVSPKRTPTVILSAIVCDKNGNPLDLVEYHGVQYTKEGFINKVLATVNKADFGKNYFTRTEVSTAADGTPIYEYTQIGANDVKLVSANNGLGSVNVAVADETAEYWTNLVATTKTDDKGNNYTTYTADQAHFSSVNVYLASATNNSISDKATAATGGAMIYPIPLTHLNTANDDEIMEGQYGLVRNHCYTLSISKIKTLGDGVFVPKKVGDEEPETIDPEDPKDPTYYVVSAINILSWKVVSQEVEI